jgi:hypothetical protein
LGSSADGLLRPAGGCLHCRATLLAAGTPWLRGAFLFLVAGLHNGAEWPCPFVACAYPTRPRGSLASLGGRSVGEGRRRDRSASGGWYTSGPCCTLTAGPSHRHRRLLAVWAETRTRVRHRTRRARYRAAALGPATANESGLGGGKHSSTALPWSYRSRPQCDAIIG